MGQNILKFRPAAKADAEALVGVINRAFAVEKKFFDAERIDKPEVLAHMDKGVFLVAEDSERLAGCVYVELPAEVGYFGLLSVEPGQQGRGLGKALIEQAEGFCRQAGRSVMEIRVLDLRTELPPLYEKLGYRVARTEPAPQKPGAFQPYHFIIMEKSLL
jgi:GNAT superfamily N-acetyltransferase